MAQGLLEVTGLIDLSQFWPDGNSDADTIRVKVADPLQDFRFRSVPGEPFRITQAFRGAIARSALVKKPFMTKKGVLEIRLQGIDAPELHYDPLARLKRKNVPNEHKELFCKWSRKYRQHMAESATRALAQFLRTLGGPLLPCTVRTAVDAPSDVVDVYGRFVGEVYVMTPDGEQSVNLWLAENGWVMPAFYTSMSAEEIQAITDAATRAYSAGLGLWPLYSGDARVRDFDPGMVYRSKPPADANADRGPVLFPKLWRRLAAFVARQGVKSEAKSFGAYLRSKRPGDAVHWTSEFLEQGAGAAPLHFLDEFVESGQFIVWPEEIVFREQPSKLVDSRNQEIREF